MSAQTIYPCGGWKVLSVSTQGLRAAADTNADEKVDGADLTMLLNNWGAAVPIIKFLLGFNDRLRVSCRVEDLSCQEFNLGTGLS